MGIVQSLASTIGAVGTVRLVQVSREMSVRQCGGARWDVDTDADQTAELTVGDLAPDFRLPSGDGREIALSAFRGRAHVVLFFVRAYG